LLKIDFWKILPLCWIGHPRLGCPEEALRKAKLAGQFHLLGFQRVLRHKPFSENCKIIIGSGHFGVRKKLL